MKMKDILQTGPGPDIFLMLTHNENNLSSSMNITENSGVFSFDIDLGSIDFLEAHDEVIPEAPFQAVEQFRFASTTDPYMGIKQRIPISIDDTESSCSQFSESGRSESENTTTSTYSIKQRLHKTVLKRCKAEGKDLFQPEKDKEVIMPTKEEEAKTQERKERNKLSAKKSRESKKAAAEELKKENEKLKTQNSSLRASVQELEEKLRRFELIKREISNSNTEPRIQQEQNDDCFMATGRNTDDNLSCDALADYSPEEYELIEGKEITQFIETYLGQEDTQQDSHSLQPPELPQPRHHQHPELSQPRHHQQEVSLSISNGSNSSDSQLTVSGAVYCQNSPSMALPNNLHVKTSAIDTDITYKPSTDWETEATESNGVSDQWSCAADSTVVVKEANVVRVGALSLRTGCTTPLASPPATSCINENSLTQSVSKHEPDARTNKTYFKRPSPWTVAEENKDEETAELKEFFLANGNREPPEKKTKY